MKCFGTTNYVERLVIASYCCLWLYKVRVESWQTTKCSKNYLHKTMFSFHLTVVLFFKRMYPYYKSNIQPTTYLTIIIA